MVTIRSKIGKEVVSFVLGEDYREIKKPLSYFARAIRGGRENLEFSRIIFSEMEKYSAVLSRHVVRDDVEQFEENWRKRFPKIDVYQRDTMWLDMSKFFAADASVESMGVGYETGYAFHVRKIPSIVFRHESQKDNPTMILTTSEEKEVSLEDLLKIHHSDIPVFYYNQESIKEVAEREVKNLFKRSSSKNIKS